METVTRVESPTTEEKHNPGTQDLKESYEKLKSTWELNMGQETWPIFDSCLAAVSTLFLGELRNPIGIILLGKSSGGKTTILNMFKDMPDGLSMYFDDISAAGFVSQSGNLNKEKADEVDLLPKLKNKILITPEMAPVFAKNETELRKNLGTLIRIMDGQGYRRHGGILGSRGYEGEYKFTFLGAAVKLTTRVWDLFRENGTRFLFLEMPNITNETDMTERLMRQISSRGNVLNTEPIIHGLTQRHMTLMLSKYSIRSQGNMIIPEELQAKFVLLAQLIVRLRSEISVGDNRTLIEYEETELPHRLINQLSDLMNGHALASGASAIGIKDYYFVGKIALSSTPNHRGNVVNILLAKPGYTLSEIVSMSSFGRTKVEYVLRELVVLDVAEVDGKTQGNTARYSILPKWRAIV